MKYMIEAQPYDSPTRWIRSGNPDGTQFSVDAASPAEAANKARAEFGDLHRAYRGIPMDLEEALRTNGEAAGFTFVEDQFGRRMEMPRGFTDETAREYITHHCAAVALRHAGGGAASLMKSDFSQAVEEGVEKGLRGVQFVTREQAARMQLVPKSCPICEAVADGRLPRSARAMTDAEPRVGSPEWADERDLTDRDLREAGEPEDSRDDPAAQNDDSFDAEAE